MTHALNDDDDILSSIVGNLKIEVLGLVTKTQKCRPQMCVEESTTSRKERLHCRDAQSAKPLVLMARASDHYLHIYIYKLIIYNKAYAIMHFFC